MKALQLKYRAPLAWDELLAFLAPRAIPGVEEVSDGVYRRTFAGGHLEATHAGRVVRVKLSAHRAPPGVVPRLRALFDLDAEPRAIARHLRADPSLAESLRARPGLRVPGAWDSFETCVRAILGQQVSVRGATTLSGRLVAALGTPLARPVHGLTHEFPSARKVARLSAPSLARIIGLPGARAEAIRQIARAHPLRATADLSARIDQLCALPGIGPWTAHYLAMRVFREADAFPSGDLVLCRSAGDLSPRALEQRAEAWRPFRAYAAMHLWRSS